MEVRTAINNLKNGKSPGPDGFTVLFYKTFADKLCSPLQKTFNSILEEGVPESWKEADIIVIPKEGKEVKEIKNYRPISLLNSDYKIFTSILAARLREYLKDWIDQDQRRFLPKRQLRENIRIVLNVLEAYEKRNNKELGIMLLDLEKSL